jgi:ATP-dependent Zn protease
METPPDQATAYHEAGHAVVALALGRSVHQVSILPNRDRLGVCEFRKPNLRPSEDWIEREILISLGGIAAEARHTGIHAWESAGRDFQYVHQLAVERAGQRRAERYASRMLSKVEHLISRDENWRAIERIAKALLETGAISGRAARHFFDECRDAR